MKYMGSIWHSVWQIRNTLLALIFLILWLLACVFWVSLSVLFFHKILGNAQKWGEGAVFMPSSSWTSGGSVEWMGKVPACPAFGGGGVSDFAEL